MYSSIIAILRLPAVCWGYFDGLLSKGISGDFLPFDDDTEAVLLSPTLNPRTVFIIIIGIVRLELAGEGGLLHFVIHFDFSFV